VAALLGPGVYNVPGVNNVPKQFQTCTNLVTGRQNVKIYDWNLLCFLYIYKWIPTVEYIPTGTIIGDQARLDISARSVWNMRERAFFDVRILHAPAPTNMNEPIQQMYRAHENESLQCQSYTG
jgi:hypothetical protein